MSDWGQNTDDSVDGSPYVQQLELYPGQPCISCSTPTEPGSGNFVNRIVCDHWEVTGYMCAECQEECET